MNYALALPSLECGHPVRTAAEKLIMGERLLAQLRRRGIPERSRWNEARTVSTVAWQVRELRREFSGRAGR